MCVPRPDVSARAIAKNVARTTVNFTKPQRPDNGRSIDRRPTGHTMSLAITRPVTLAVALMAVAACDSGPSDFFRSIDTNNDQHVDLQEWMAYYGPHRHNWQRCSGKDFEPADCDGDQALSWSEYRSARFDGLYCGDRTPFIKRIYRKPVLQADGQTYVLLSPCKRPAAGAQAGTRRALASSSGPSVVCDPSP